MEIDITRLVEAITSPFVFLYRAFLRLIGRRAGSRRSRLSRYSPVQKRLRTLKFIQYASVLGLVGVVGGIVLFFGMFAWFSRDLPKPGQIVRREGFSTTILDRNGKSLYDLFDKERRIPVTIDQMPLALRQATVAVEDKDFYKHSGVDLLTPIRIVYNVVFRQRVVGGSTLTQQLVKNVLLTNERSLTRKFKEFVLALQIERQFTKDQILEMYLNEAPYGGTAWGVAAAAQQYYGKSLSELSPIEAIILAGLPQRPSAYSPFLGKTDDDGELLWKVRTKGVLRRMQEDGYITEQEHDQYVTELESIQFQRASFEISAPHFVFYVRDQLAQMYGEDVLEQGGLKVTTTLDSNLQEKAEIVVKEEIEKVKDLNITNGASIAMDPKTGEILSMVGSVDYFSKEIDGQFNVAVNGLRQPGSSIKPLTYLLMFRNGYNPGSMIVDAETSFTPNAEADAYEPKNYDGKFRGPVSLRDSLGSSLNIPAVKSLAMVGIDAFLHQAYDMGFVTLEPTAANKQRFGLSATLGGAEVHLIDTVSAYSSFANGGRKVEQVSILKVENKDGRVLYEHKPIQGPEVLSSAEAFLINHVLSDNSARLLAFGANSLLNTGKPIAVKTGTTNDQRDNWTIGWSQEIMVGVWVGNNDNSAMKRVASGITGASPIWRRIILDALAEGYKAPEWVVPSTVEAVRVDSVSGYPSHDGYPEKAEYVIKGSLATTPDPIHTKLKLCRGENKLANQARVASGDYEEKEFIILKEDDPVSQDGRNRWMEGITNWINGQDDSRYKVPTEYCGDSGDVFVRLNKPENEKNFPQESIEIEAESDSGEGIEKLEIIVNGSIKETVQERTFKKVLQLPKGRYEIYVKAYSRNGKTAESGKAHIGTGGENWNAPQPSPSPSPTPLASPILP